MVHEPDGTPLLPDPLVAVPVAEEGGPEQENVASPVEEPRTRTEQGGDFNAIQLRDRVVIMLLFKELVHVDQVERAWQKWSAGGPAAEALWRVLAREPDVKREVVYEEAAQVYSFKIAEINRLSALQFIRENRESFSDEQWGRMQEMGVLPVAHDDMASGDRRWIFVSFDPTRPDLHRFLHGMKLKSYEVRYVSEAVLETLVEQAVPRKNEFLERVRFDTYDLGASHIARSSLIDEDALEAEISRSSLINLFEATLVEAVRQSVSDIHIFPNDAQKIEIHFRKDGELNCWHVGEKILPEAFLAVVKDNTVNVDRFERDTAQDGFLERIIDDNLIRFRVSVLPLAGVSQDVRPESIVIRVLDDRKVASDLQQIGFRGASLAMMERAIREPHGIVIVTGPTGSGKSTTLYAALANVVSPRINVLTVEDPVEYRLPGVRQIKIGERLPLGEALRSILRHDPDVVMVGEMRDRETAELAIKLANTGHLTFSTLHTNDAASAISRLYMMGIEPFLIAYSINLVVSQRLVRTLCPVCREEDPAPDRLVLERLGFEEGEMPDLRLNRARIGRRCDTCHGTGHRGRRAAIETMPVTTALREVILRAPGFVDEAALRAQARADGMVSLGDAVRQMLREGVISVQEALRVVSTG